MTAYQYRAYNIGVYGIEGPMIGAWTSKPMIVDTILSLFDLTTKAVDSNSGSREKEPRSQLPTLAGVLFESISERLGWLKFVQFITNLFFIADSDAIQACRR